MLIEPDTSIMGTACILDALLHKEQPEDLKIFSRSIL